MTKLEEIASAIKRALKQRRYGLCEYENDATRDAWSAWKAVLAWKRAKSAWQPIETAPMDGTPILIGCTRTKSMRWAVWSEGFWRDGQTAAGGRICGVPVPTHWRHLPEPPK